MEYFVRLLDKYRNKGVLIDSNLLLIYCVGMHDPERLKRFKRTVAFDLQDFRILERFVGFFSEIITTPNILTEVNSFSNQLPEEIKVQYYPEFAKQIRLLTEQYVPSADVSRLPSFDRLGLTDMGIASFVRDQYLVLSDDLKLTIFLQNAGVDAINFNHLRVIGWN